MSKKVKGDDANYASIIWFRKPWKVIWPRAVDLYDEWVETPDKPVYPIFCEIRTDDGEKKMVPAYHADVNCNVMYHLVRKPWKLANTSRYDEAELRFRRQIYALDGRKIATRS